MNNAWLICLASWAGALGVIFLLHQIEEALGWGCCIIVGLVALGILTLFAIGIV